MFAANHGRGGFVAAALAACAVSFAVSANPALTGVSELAIGATHGCAALQDRGAMCWGKWQSPALGRQTPGRAAAPVEQLPHVTTDIAAGRDHSCAIASSGALFCWGSNNSGQLGTLTGDTSLPVTVSGLAMDALRVAAGDAHTCAIRTSGAVQCWGNNASGQLGDGTQDLRTTPASVLGLNSGATSVSLGSDFSCAVVTGAARCWGAGSSGQLGDGSVLMRTAPVQVSTLASGVAAIAAGGAHACALTTAGAMKCWGANDSGQLGDGSLAQRDTPVNVLGLSSGVVAIGTGAKHSCAIRNDGSVWCWGDNEFGQLGDDTLDDRVIAAPVVGLSSAALQVEAGDRLTCVRLAGGTVRCFGDNTSNELGNNSLYSRTTPVVVPLGAPTGSIGAGGTHTCGVTTAGAVLCWGRNGSGQIGDGTRVPRALPRQVVAHASGVDRVTAGYEHSCSLSTGGAVRCWGGRTQGQLGDGLTGGSATSPVDVVGLSSGALSVHAGYSHTCAVAAGGAAKCWGSNASGELGNGDFMLRNQPADVVGLSSGVVSLAPGAGHTCALRTGGGIKCWGSNAAGQLGDGTTLLRTTGVDVVGIHSGATVLAAGASHTCAVVAGSVRCWGSNSFGQLGSKSYPGQSVPGLVVGLPADVIALAAGEAHTCALLGNGEVRCWGSNYAGQLGGGAGSTAYAPVGVELPAPAVAISAGGAHTCAVLQGGEARCWGRSSDGALGAGDAFLSAVPVDVVLADFAPEIVLATSPNPSSFGDAVTITVKVTTADGNVGGQVVVRDGPGLICRRPLMETNTVTCSAVLSPGMHTIAADYDPLSTFTALPGSVSVQHLVNLVSGQNCAGFDDVEASHPLCRNVEWIRNRSITLGCAGFDYCPGTPVSRLAMAAFLNRLGRAVTPSVKTGSSFPYGLDNGACSIFNLPPADYPRRAYVDAIVSGRVVADAEITARIEVHELSNNTLSFLSAGPTTRVSVPANRFTSFRVSAPIDVAAGMQVEFVVQTARIQGPYQWDNATCLIRAVFFDREETFSPLRPAAVSDREPKGVT